MSTDSDDQEVPPSRRLVDMGFSEPWAADLHLEFQRRHPKYDLAECFENPEYGSTEKLG